MTAWLVGVLAALVLFACWLARALDRVPADQETVFTLAAMGAFFALLCAAAFAL